MLIKMKKIIKIEHKIFAPFHLNLKNYVKTIRYQKMLINMYFLTFFAVILHLYTASALTTIVSSTVRSYRFGMLFMFKYFKPSESFRKTRSDVIFDTRLQWS